MERAKILENKHETLEPRHLNRPPSGCARSVRAEAGPQTRGPEPIDPNAPLDINQILLGPHRERPPRPTEAELEEERRLRKEAREAEERARELEELERDTRTVFAYNLPTKADERDIFTFFSQAGTVLDVRIIYDRNTPRSKGMAYIEMGDRLEVPAALALTGQVMKGQLVMVKASEAEKNIAWEQQQAAKAAGLTPGGMGGGMPVNAAAVMGGDGPCKLYCGGLNAAITEAELKEVFAPFGAIEFAVVQKDAGGRSLGYGFVQFLATQSANLAVQARQPNPRVTPVCPACPDSQPHVPCTPSDSPAHPPGSERHRAGRPGAEGEPGVHEQRRPRGSWGGPG